MFFKIQRVLPENLRPFVHVPGTDSNEANGFHADIREVDVTGKLSKALDAVLERLDNVCEVQVEILRCNTDKDTD